MSRQDELEGVRKKNESEEARRRSLRGVTRRSEEQRRVFVAAFLADDAIARYPADAPAFVDDAESRTLHEALTDAVDQAFGWAEQDPPTAPSTIAQAILTAHDHDLAFDVAALPGYGLAPARVLAHIESLGFGLDPASIAHSAVLILLNRGRAAPPTPDVAREPVAPPAAAAAARPQRRRVVGYVEVVERLEFRQEEAILPGVVLERLEAEEREGVDGRGRQMVLVLWRGKTRLVLAKCVRRADAGAWRNQHEGVR